jgi:DNA ligase (NAD+)
LDARLGDEVYVEKGGEIIPKIVGVNTAARSSASTPVKFIENCPECGTPLVKKEGEAAHYCPNEYGCPPQIRGRIAHFISRRAMDIGAAEATIEQLYGAGMIQDAGDLYRLRKEDVVGLERFADKSASNLIESIDRSRNVPFERVLYALGIRYVGETVAKKLARHFTSLDRLREADFDTLVAADEVGERIAESIIQFFRNPKSLDLLEKLQAAGLRFTMEPEQAATGHALEGLTFVISGSFERFSRDELKGLIEANGGRNAGSISSRTDYLLGGVGIGPGKLKKVEALNIPIISETEFLAMIRP